MEQQLLQAISQFGAAGIIAWMWLSERRHASERDRQLDAAHGRVMEQKVALDQLIEVVSGNTKAVGALEAVQRRVLEVVERSSAA